MILRPGAQPPWLVPYCALCKGPVERFTFLPVTSPYYLELEGLCCGRTQGIRLSNEDVLRIKRGNEKLFLITKTGAYQGIGELRRAG